MQNGHRLATAFFVRPVAVVLTTSVRDRANLESARGSLLLVFTARVHDAARTLVDTGASILIVRTRDADGMLLDGFVRSVLQRAPRLIVILLASAEAAGGSDLLALQRAGAVDVFFDGLRDLPGRLWLLAISASRRVRLKGFADRAVKDLSPLLGALVYNVLARGDVPRNVARLAADVGLRNVAAAERMLGAYTALTPRRLLSQARLLAATVVFDSSLARSDLIAHELEFASGSALCNLLVHHLSMNRAQLCAAGGSEYVFLRIQALLSPPTGPRIVRSDSP